MMLNYLRDTWMTLSGQLSQRKSMRNYWKWTTYMPTWNLPLNWHRRERLPFLDMLLIRKERRVESTWYCKPTDTGLVMNFHALAPKRYKRRVVSGFVHRIHRSCSTWENFHNSLTKAKEVLEKNQYPPPFYEDVIAQTLEKILAQSDVEKNPAAESEVQCKHRVLMQYRGSATDQFMKKLKDCGAPVQVVLTLRKLRSCLPTLKVPVQKMLKSDVVYKISCPRCEACYVGKTSRHLATRFAEHKTTTNGPVVQHMRSCQLQSTDLNVEVLRTVLKGGFVLSIMEALYIRELCPSLNTRDAYRDYDLTIMF